VTSPSVTFPLAHDPVHPSVKEIRMNKVLCLVLVTVGLLGLAFCACCLPCHKGPPPGPPVAHASFDSGAPVASAAPVTLDGAAPTSRDAGNCIGSDAGASDASPPAPPPSACVDRAQLHAVCAAARRLCDP
jgi:hypothetical protein